MTTNRNDEVSATNKLRSRSPTQLARGKQSTARARALVASVCLLFSTPLHAQAAVDSATANRVTQQEEAAALADQALKDVTRGQQALNQGSYDEALNYINRAINAYSNLPGLLAITPTFLYQRANAYTLLGQTYVRQHNYAAALEALGEARRIYGPFIQSGDDFWTQALKKGSGMEHLLSNISLAFQLNIEALKKSDKCDDATDSALQFAELLDRFSLENEALLMLDQTLADCKDRAIRQKIIKALNGEATFLINLHRSHEAIAKIEEAEKLALGLSEQERTQAGALEADLAKTHGYILLATGRSTDAVTYLKRALDMFAQMQDGWPGQAQCWMWIGQSYVLAGQFPQAAAAFLEAETIYKSKQSTVEEYRMHSMLALAYMRMGDDFRSEREFATAESLASTVNIPSHVQLELVRNQAVFQRDRGQHEKAIAASQKAIELLNQIPDSKSEQAQLHGDIAGELQALGRFDEARSELQSGIEVLKGGSTLDHVTATLRLRLAQDRKDRLGDKSAYVNECKTILANLPDSDENLHTRVTCLNQIGLSLNAAGQYADAEKQFKDALAILRAHEHPSRQIEQIEDVEYRSDLVRTVLVNLGLTLISAGQDRDGIQALWEAARTNQEQYLLNLISMSDFQRLQYIESGIARNGARELTVAASFLSEEIPAERSFEAAVDGKGLYTQASKIKQQLIHSTVSAKNQASLEEYIELRRRAATRVLEWQRPESAQQEEAGPVEALLRQIDELDQSLMPDSARVAKAARLLTVDAAAVVRRLRRKEALLEYVEFRPISREDVNRTWITHTVPRASETHYGVFVVSKQTDHIVAVDLGPTKKINESIDTYRATFKRQINPGSFSLNEEELNRAGAKIRHYLIDPVLKYVGDSSRWYVAPAGAISLVPFEALPMTQPPGGQRYLIEGQQIVYVDSARSLLPDMSQELTSPSKTAFLVGAPSYDAIPEDRVRAIGKPMAITGPVAQHEPLQPIIVMGSSSDSESADQDARIPSQWRPLKGTQELLSAVASSLRNVGIVVSEFIENSASEESLLTIHRPQIVVFSTHGYYNIAEPQVKFEFTKLTIQSDKPAEIEGLSPYALLSSDPLMRSWLILAGANYQSEQGTGHSPGQTGTQETAARRFHFKMSGLKIPDVELGDGVLTAYEAWTTDLGGTELVVLAACETGVGAVQGESARSAGLRQASGEVVSGFRQAFLVAGARSLVMSMWPVPLNETVDEFRFFFQKWLEHDGEGRYIAFREAEIATLNHARETQHNGHPFWWAGFVYSGDPGDR